MPQIPGYNDSILPGGSIQAQASPQDFGAGVGAAVQNFGDKAFSQESDFLMQVEQDRGRVWAFDAASKKYVDLKQTFDQQVKDLNPEDPQFSAKVGGLVDSFKSQAKDATNQLMEMAPSRSARRMIASHMGRVTDSLTGYAMGEQSRIEGQLTSIQVQDGLKQSQDRVAADPSNENYKQIRDDLKQHIAGFNTLDPATKLKWMEDSEHGLAVTQVESLVAGSPEGFLGVVHPQGGRLTPSGVKGAVPGGGNPVDFQKVFANLLKQESGGNQAAVSAKGAVGVAQILPSTGPEAAQLAGMPWDPERFKTDKEYNAALGSAYFNAQLSRFGSVDKALAAYNAGPTAVASLIREHGDNWLTYAPKETQQYVAAITKASGVEKEAPVLASVPQVQPLSDTDIAQAAPPIEGWGKLTWPEKVQMVRKAEAAMGGQLASDRGLMDKELRDATSSLLSGKDYPGIESARFSLPNFMRLYGQEEGQRRFDQLGYVRGIGHFVGQLQQMPYDQAVAFLQKQEPQGGPEFADKKPVYDMAVKALDQVQQMRNQDYMGWALGSGMKGAQPLDFSSADKLQASLAGRVPLANAGRTDFKADAHLLSKDEANQFGDALTRYTPEQQVQVLKALKAGAGNWYGDALAQIAPKNTSVAFAGAVTDYKGTVSTAAGAQNGDTVAKYILEGAHILQGKDLGDPTKTGRPLQIDDKAFRNMFWSAVGPDAFSSPDAQRSNQAAADTMQAVKNYLAADLYHRGLDPHTITTDVVKNAVQAVTGGTVKSPNGDSLFVPWGMDPKAFQQTFPRAVAAAVGDAGLKGTKLDNPDAYRYINLDDGRYMVMNANRQPLYGKNGPVIVDMKKPIPPDPTEPQSPGYTLVPTAQHFRRGVDY